MEIEARVQFVIRRIITKHSITVKELAVLCEWKYQNLLKRII